MKKAVVNKYTILIYLILINNVALLAQPEQIKGKIIHQSTNEGIEGVIITNNKEKSLSNTEGEFSINLYTKEDILTFNHINYETQSTLGSQNMIIKMIPTNTELDEIIVFKQPLSQVFAAAFKNMTKITQKGDLYKTYVRAFNFLNNNPTNFADALVNYYITKANKNAFIDIREQRTFKSKNELEANTDLQETFNVLGVDIKDLLVLEKDAANLLECITKSNQYDYRIQKKTSLEGNKIIINFSPSNNTIDWIPYEGYIVFDETQTKILEYKYYIPKNYKNKTKELKLFTTSFQIANLEKHVIFTEDPTSYHLFYHSSFIELNIKEKNGHNFLFGNFSEIAVETLLKNQEIPKTKQFVGNLFKLKSNYQSEYWKDRNLRPLSNKEYLFLSQLEESK